MNLQMKLHILGADRYSMEGGNKGASIYVLEDHDTNEADKVGRPVMACKCDYDFLDELKKHNYPGNFECTAELVSGAKKKSTIYIKSVKPIPANPAINK